MPQTSWPVVFMITRLLSHDQEGDGGRLLDALTGRKVRKLHFDAQHMFKDFVVLDGALRLRLHSRKGKMVVGRGRDRGNSQRHALALTKQWTRWRGCCDELGSYMERCDSGAASMAALSEIIKSYKVKAWKGNMRIVFM